MDKSAGQALVIVLLSLAVVVTVVLSIVSYTTNDVRITELEEESFRAFSAAEAGIEKALLTASDQSGSFGEGVNSSTFTTTVSQFGTGTYVFNYPAELLSGEAATIWFVAHDSDGNLGCGGSVSCFTGSSMQLCWGKGGEVPPAVEVSVYYKPTPNADVSGNIRVARATYDPVGSRVSSNNFTQTSGGSCSITDDYKEVSYTASETINFGTMGIPSSVYGNTDGLQFARVRLLYNDVAQPLGVRINGGNPLPSQGLRAESVGESQGTVRKINVFKLYPDLPTVLDTSIYSPNDIVKVDE